MKKRAKRCEPVHVEKWGDFWVEDGILNVAFWSGQRCYRLVMGPYRCMEGMERAKRALSKTGEIIPLPARKAATEAH